MNNGNTLDRKKFTSKWEYTQKASSWHFDKWRVEIPPYKIICNLKDCWGDELDKLTYEINVGTSGYGYMGKKGDGIIENDFLDWGYREDMIQFKRTYNVPEGLINIIEPLGLISPDVRIHCQMPGMVTPIHVDGYTSHPEIDKNPDRDMAGMTRLIIQLTDWEWGHFWSFGNSSWQQWKAGDVAFFDSREIVHAAANAGNKPRITMIVTGWLSEITQNLIKQA